MKRKKILIAFGTRPEALKFAPLIQALKTSQSFNCYVCITGQHREMLDQVVRFFKIKIDADLNLMRPNQSLEYVSGRVIIKFGKILRQVKPDLVFVQGDTATAVMVAISSYYSKIPIAHLEAGLRTWNKYHPFPEEGNRTIISHLADFHFTPTPMASQNLIREGINPKSIFELGNTIVDTVRLAKPMVKKKYSVFRTVDFSRRILLVTAHRRESFGQGLEQIFTALKDLVRKFRDIEIIYPVHLNPKVALPARKILGGIDRIHLIRPLTYEETHWIIGRSYLILTDSGGIQEEAPSFKKPVLVLREVTERPEGIKAGIAKIVGTDQKRIFSETAKLLTSKNVYRQMIAQENPYGGGFTSQSIVRQLEKFLK